MASTFCPPPRLRTLMLLSVRLPTERVPTWVGCRRMSGGSRRVYLGSKRIARAVARCSAISSCEEAVLVRE
jgi:hypothetical protein